MDYVFCCEVLHHNDRANLRRTMRELHRVLRPGGRLFVVNEPLRFLLRPKLDHGSEVAEFDGNEHVYFLPEYYRAARGAGFEVAAPWLRGIAPLHPSAPVPDSHRLAPLHRVLRRRAAGRGLIGANRIARYAWRHLIYGDRSLFLDCTKPG
jgi:SAM-dependent methyltransferase